MKKRGQDSGVFRYVFIAVIAILIMSVGVKAFQTIQGLKCRADTVDFKIDVETLGQDLEHGSVRLEKLPVPCGADKVYFVDTTNEASPVLLKQSVLMRDSLKNGLLENIFLTKKSTLENSFDAGQVEIGYPNYLCIKPTNGKVSVFVKRDGKGIVLTEGCGERDCTDIPVDPTDYEAMQMLKDFVDFGCENCPKNTETEFDNYKESREKVEIYRRFVYCSKTGITRVEVIIHPKEKLEDFYYYENIPKECVESLQEYLQGDVEGDVTIKDDPLMMWHFDKVKGETKVSYSLKKQLSDRCKKLFLGLGVERIVQGQKIINKLKSPTTPTAPTNTPTQPTQPATAPTISTAAPTPTIPTAAPTPASTPTPQSPSPAPSCIDDDGDGYGQNCPSGSDCDDNDPAINPTASEVCGNSKDDNCDGQKDEGCSGMCDTDGDGYDEFLWCVGGGSNDDCNDNDANIYPGASEICDSKDNNCDTNVDEGLINCCSGVTKNIQADSNNCGACGSTCAPTEACQSGVCSCVDSSWSPLPSTVCSGQTYSQTSNCGNTKQSSGTKQCQASLSLTFSNVNYQFAGGMHKYLHTRTFKETNGVGVTLTQGKLCASTGCQTASVNYRINGDGQYTWNEQFYTNLASESFTLTYSGTGDNGIPISIGQSMSVAGSTHTP